MSAPRITLDQWNALVTVVESGGYAQAADRLHRTQSTLTYTLKKLSELTGVQIFERKGRRSVLTPAGEVLYRRGRILVAEAVRLEQATTALARGWEPVIRLAVEIVFPTWLLLECLASFSAAHPQVRIELEESVLDGTDEALLQGRVDFAIGTLVPAGFLGDPLLPLEFLCVAAPDHPLHHTGGPVTLEDLKRHRHLVIRGSSAQRARSAGWLNEERWTVTAKATSIRAATLGLGYAWYDKRSIRDELASGCLKPLPLREGAERRAMTYLIFADRDAAGPGALRLAAIIRDRVAAECAGA